MQLQMAGGPYLGDTSPATPDHVQLASLEAQVLTPTCTLSPGSVLPAGFGPHLQARQARRRTASLAGGDRHPRRKLC